MYFKLSFLLLFALPAWAQKVYDLPTALETAKAQHLGLKTAALEVEMLQKAEKSAFDLPKTEFMGQYGNVNDFQVDYSLNVSQAFSLPNVYQRKLAYNQAQTRLSQQKKAVQERELLLAVKSLYFDIVFLYEKEAFLQKQDTLYQQLARGAEVRVRTGEGKALEKLSADLQLRDVQNQLRQTRADLLLQKNELCGWLNVKEDIEIADKKLTKRALQTQNPALTQMPQVQMLQQQILVQKTFTEVQKSAYSPDLRVGYYNMRESGNPNLHVAQLGVAIPLWNKGRRANVESAKAGEQMAEQQLAYQQQQLENELVKWQMQYQKSLQALAYYEEQALPQIAQMEMQLQKAYTNGEIGYVEWTQNRLQTFQIQLNYLQELANYNQILVQLESFNL